MIVSFFTISLISSRKRIGQETRKEKLLNKEVMSLTNHGSYLLATTNQSPAFVGEAAAPGQGEPGRGF